MRKVIMVPDVLTGSLLEMLLSCQNPAKKNQKPSNNHPVKKPGYLKNKREPAHLPEIVRVDYSGDVTVVYWADNVLTTVRRYPDDPDNKEMALAMAIAKRAFGNTSRYYNVFSKFVPGLSSEK